MDCSFPQTMEMNIGIRRVLDGGFSYIRNYYAIRILKETHHSRGAGDNPFHISTARYPLFAGNTWAFRCVLLTGATVIDY